MQRDDYLPRLFITQLSLSLHIQLAGVPGNRDHVHSQSNGNVTPQDTSTRFPLNNISTTPILLLSRPEFANNT